ncbi:MAG: vitamin B12 dependent methionine synthase [Thermoleophilia bacterium]|nr:vitamin B12 dependent methionine synthase [Thermoleophilia bacterium]
MVILQDVPFPLDVESLMEKYRVGPDSEYAPTFREFVARVQDAARPKAVYEVAYIDEKGDDYVVVEGVRFTSRALRKHLTEAERVFPYVVTCGTEVDAARRPDDGIRQKAWLYMLKGELVSAGVAELARHIGEHQRIAHLSSMNPGSGDLTMWPLAQQKELFSLLGDVEEAIGVRLTASHLLMPEMSVSGLMFPTEFDFHSCQVCHRERCPNRRAPYSQEDWETYCRE